MRRRPVLVAVLVASALEACAEPAVTPLAPMGLTAHGGELVLSMGDGRELHSQELLGATLTVGGTRVRLDAIERASLPRGGTYVLHHFTRLDGSGETSEFCTMDAEGRRWALPFVDAEGQLYLACSAGAIGKCARWGYWPQDPATRELHEACTRMVRADYGGDGATATRDGTAIKLCDRLGILPCDDGHGPLEAAWSRDGAVCVARPRLSDLATLEQLEARYPWLKDHLGETACTLDAAWDEPRAVLFGFVP